MKYLKTFENKENIKTYNVYKPDNDVITQKNTYFFIYKIINIANKITINRIYKYNRLKRELKEENKNKNLTVPLNLLKNGLLFSSDNLQECIDMLDMLDNQEKYNI